MFSFNCFNNHMRTYLQLDEVVTHEPIRNIGSGFKYWRNFRNIDQDVG